VCLEYVEDLKREALHREYEKTQGGDQSLVVIEPVHIHARLMIYEKVSGWPRVSNIKVNVISDRSIKKRRAWIGV